MIKKINLRKYTMSVFLHTHQKTLFKRMRWEINIVKYLCQMFKGGNPPLIFFNAYVFFSLVL